MEPVSVFLAQWNENLDYLYKLFYFLTKEGDPELREILEEYKNLSSSDLDKQIYLLLKANNRIEQLQLSVFNKINKATDNANPNLQEFISGNRVIENKIIPQLIYFNYSFKSDNIEEDKKKLRWKPQIDFFTELIENKLRISGADLGASSKSASSENGNKRNAIQYLDAFEFSNLYDEDYTFSEIIERYCPLTPEIKERIALYAQELSNGIKEETIAKMEDEGNFKIVIIQKYPKFKNFVPPLVKYQPVIDEAYLHLSNELFQLRKKRAEAQAQLRTTKSMESVVSSINKEIDAKNAEKDKIISQKQQEFLKVVSPEEIAKGGPLSIQAWPQDLLGPLNKVFYKKGKYGKVPNFWLVVFYNGNGRYQPLKDLQREYIGTFPRFDLIKGSKGIRDLIVSVYGAEADKELPQLPLFAPQKRDEIDQVQALEALKQIKKKTQKTENVITLPNKMDNKNEPLVEPSSDEKCYTQFYLFLKKQLNAPMNNSQRSPFSQKFFNLIANQKTQEMCKYLTKTYDASLAETYRKGLPFLKEQVDLINKAYKLEGVSKELKELVVS